MICAVFLITFQDSSKFRSRGRGEEGKPLSRGRGCYAVRFFFLPLNFPARAFGTMEIFDVGGGDGENKRIVKKDINGENREGDIEKKISLVFFLREEGRKRGKTNGST